MSDAKKTYRCDIIVVTWNKLDYIRQCVESILRNTTVKSRLLIVDNASEEDTRAYLKGLRGNAAVSIQTIFNDTNLGPGKARNRALREFDADYACFVDSDVTVTPDWLSGMMAVAEANADIGMLNPSSNNFNQVPPEGVSLDEYARSLKQYERQYLEVGHCISFCMLIKKEVVERIGFMDEDYVLALYEDTDYSMKASDAGYRCVIVKSSYVWHYGHGSTGRVQRIDAIAEKNKERFYKKWGRPLRIMRCSAIHTQHDAFGKLLASSVMLARKGDFVYLFIMADPTRSRSNMFNQFGMAEHANVHVHSYPGKRGFKWFCLWMLLKRLKKRYDIAVTEDTAIAGLLRGFRIFHRAEVITDTDGESLMSVVHRKKFEGSAS